MVDNTKNPMAVVPLADEVFFNAYVGNVDKLRIYVLESGLFGIALTNSDTAEGFGITLTRDQLHKLASAIADYTVTQ